MNRVLKTILQRYGVQNYTWRSLQLKNLWSFKVQKIKKKKCFKLASFFINFVFSLKVSIFQIQVNSNSFTGLGGYIHWKRIFDIAAGWKFAWWFTSETNIFGILNFLKILLRVFGTCNENEFWAQNYDYYDVSALITKYGHVKLSWNWR